ncbi:MAG: adenylyl-sulfate kinase [Alphaproteobacteria bacterium]
MPPRQNTAPESAVPGGSADEVSFAARLHVPVLGAPGHGKSSLVERLLHDADALPASGAATGPGCFLLASGDDAHPDVLLIDALGARALLKSLADGGALGEVALLVIDAETGLDPATRRHAYLAHLLGLRHAVVAVNGMELVGQSAERFAELEASCRAYLAALGVTSVEVVPVSARTGANLAARDTSMAWYKGPTVLEALRQHAVAETLRALPLRIPITDVLRVEDRRIIVGRVESGRLALGDEVMFSPSNGMAKVSGIELGGPSDDGAEAGEIVRFALEDQVFVEPGEIASHGGDAPIETNVFRGRIIWLGGAPLEAGQRLTLRLGTLETPATVETVERQIDAGDDSKVDAATLAGEATGEIILRARAMLALDPHGDNPRTGRFALFEDGEAVAIGVVDMEGYPDQRPLMGVKSTNVSLVEHGVSAPVRATRNGHAGGVLWFTGLSGAGKSTLAVELEKRLFTRGYQVFVLDGDNVRQGLNANLGFSPEDRAENIRRVGEVAALFAEAGMIVITAFISPYRSDRDRARQAAGERFREVHIHADIATCEDRDPKGLYKRARAGEIPEFTGVSAPYEAPDDAELVVDTAAQSIDEAVGGLIDFVEREFELTKR